MALLPPTRNLRNEYRLRDPFAFGLSGVPYAFKTREEISQAGDSNMRKSCSPTADEHNLDLGLSIGSLKSQVTWDCDDDAPSVSASNTTLGDISAAKSQGSQLTIFYAGMVIAYKDVNKELAKTIISLAHASGQMSKMTSQKFQSLCLEKKEMPVVKVQHIGIRKARRASLHRFLVKRRQRVNERLLHDLQRKECSAGRQMTVNKVQEMD